MKEQISNIDNEVLPHVEKEMDSSFIAEKFRKLISMGPRVPEDYTFFVQGDTLVLSSDRIFGENISTDISKVYGVLKLSEEVRNVKIVGNKIYAELSVPFGSISKMEFELEKYKV